jgi:hypothetical protein
MGQKRVWAVLDNGRSGAEVGHPLRLLEALLPAAAQPKRQFVPGLAGPEDTSREAPVEASATRPWLDL